MVMTESPDFRLTVHRRKVLAIDWHPWLVSGGPMTTMLKQRGRAGVAIADAPVGRGEGGPAGAIARPLAGDGRDSIVRWAGDVGYRRLWLPGDVVELPG